MSFILNKLTGGGAPQLPKLRIAIILQSNFAAEVLELYLDKGYEIVGVFTISDKNGREDILATTAKQLNIPVFKISAWRRKGIIIPEVFETYKSTGATLNVLPFCSQFIPMEVIDYAQMGSICYHPSVLPRHRFVIYAEVPKSDIAKFYAYNEVIVEIITLFCDH